MGSSCRNYSGESNVDTVMRLLGIDLGNAAVSRFAADYVHAVRKCKKCAGGESCRKSAQYSLDPQACPNAKLLIDLMFEALPRQVGMPRH